MLLILLEGCAGLVPKADKAVTDDEKAHAVKVKLGDAARSDLPKEVLTGPLLFDILLGEIAGQRGRIDVSGPSYLQAARLSSDPRVAERAFKIALYGKDQKMAQAAGQRWLELVPDNQEARRALIALALRSGNIIEAEKHLDYLVSTTHESDEETYSKLTAVLLREPDKARTLQVVKKLLSTRPDDANVRLMYAKLAVSAEDWALAEQEVSHILSLRPDWVQALILHAQIQSKNGQAKLAVRDLKKALARNSNDYELRLAYARLLVDARDLKEAIKQFEKLHNKRPREGQVVYSLALLYLGEKDLSTAEKYFQKLVDLKYQQNTAYYYLGAIAEDRNQPTRATENYRKIEHGEHLLDAQVRLAKIEAESGRLDEARGRLQNLRLTQPAHTQRLVMVEAELLDDAGQTRAAYDLYSQYLESLPNDLDIRYSRSLIAEQLDYLDVAEEDFKAILAVEPDNVRALNAYGYTLADRTTRFQEAYQLIKRALDQSPDDPSIMDSMGWVQYRLGNLQEARTYLGKAYELTHDAEIAAHLGEVLWFMGDKDGARKLWHAGTQVAPDNLVLQETLKRLDP
ncbi:MAG: tetratricopeptide repeat protein [Gammaproteobacteria bacterium]